MLALPANLRLGISPGGFARLMSRAGDDRERWVSAEGGLPRGSTTLPEGAAAGAALHPGMPAGGAQAHRGSFGG
jgi:hypothetical protein